VRAELVSRLKKTTFDQLILPAVSVSTELAPAVA
jgi:hypothetical protein